MFSNLFKTTYKRITFEDIQHAIRSPGGYILINTFPIGEQDCLLPTTISYFIEEKTLNDMIQQYDFKSRKIIVYGKNANDVSAEEKYKQLTTLGFSEVYLYSGGMFEWMLLQDIYGEDEFPTTTKVLDILKFRPLRRF